MASPLLEDIILKKKPSAKKAFALNDVVSFKLAHGEEIIARVASVDLEGAILTIKNPRSPQVRAHNGQPVLMLPPFMLTIDEDAEVSINPAHVVVGPMPTEKGLAQSYLAEVSPIITPKTGIIT